MGDYFELIETHRARIRQIRATLIELAEGSREPIGPTEASLLADWCDRIEDALRRL